MQGLPIMKPQSIEPTQNRWIYWLAGFLTAVFVIAILTLWVGDERAGVILLDSQTEVFPYPLTIQNVMHIFFFVGIAEGLYRYHRTEAECLRMAEKILPEDDATVLQLHELGALRLKVKDAYTSQDGILPRLIDLCILQFQSGRSVDQTVSVLDSMLELDSHKIDLHYTVLRYIVWVIPTIGFIGTVVGIANTLASVTGDPDLPVLATRLGVAFNTTLVALVMSGLLVFMTNMTQAREENMVNDIGTYVLRNLINRLYTGGTQL